MDGRKSDIATQVKVVRSYSVERAHHAYLRWLAAQGRLNVSAELQDVIETHATDRLGKDWREQFTRATADEREAVTT